jgi:HAD-superfamily hydrolase, subfamily IIB
MNLNGAVFFDLDGTLVDGRDGVLKPTQKTMEAIQKLREHNYLACLATGRSKCYVPKSAFLFDGYVTSNGAYAEIGNKTIDNNFIGAEELHRLTDALDRIGMNYVAENQERCFVKDMEEYFYLDMMKNFNMSDENFFPLGDAGSLSGQKINKFMVTYDSESKLEQFRREFESTYDITGQPGNQACDVGKKGISKAFGVERIIEHFRLDKGCTYAFGDADNDYEMFRTVGFGVAMGRHTPKLETVSGYVTKSVGEEGIYHALAHLGLI